MRLHFEDFCIETNYPRRLNGHYDCQSLSRAVNEVLKCPLRIHLGAAQLTYPRDRVLSLHKYPVFPCPGRSAGAKNRRSWTGRRSKPRLTTQGYLSVQCFSPFTNTVTVRVSHSSLAPTSKGTCVTGHMDAEKLTFLSQLHMEAGNWRILETQNSMVKEHKWFSDEFWSF